MTEWIFGYLFIGEVPRSGFTLGLASGKIKGDVNVCPFTFL